MESGVPVEDCVMQPGTTSVFSFPISAPPGALVRDSVSAIQQLGEQREGPADAASPPPSCVARLSPRALLTRGILPGSAPLHVAQGSIGRPSRVTWRSHAVDHDAPRAAPQSSSLARLNAASAHRIAELCLRYQRHWCEHKPSITVSVRDGKEWLDVASWVYGE